MHRCTLSSKRELMLPSLCVVCGSVGSEHVAYSQDKVPLILGGIAIISSRNVSWPYCSQHAFEFKSRMRFLRIFQIAFVVPGFVLVSIAALLDIPGAVRNGLCVAGLILILVPAFTLFTKRFFHDAYLSISRRRVTICAKSEAFISQLRKMNEPEPGAEVHGESRDR